MNKICFINGSPRKKTSGSSYFIKKLTSMLNNSLEVKEFFIDELMSDETLCNETLSYNKIVFVSPLYVDCLPVEMLTFMIEFEKFIKTKENLNIDVYALINCGFLEGPQNHIALDIIKNYTKRLNLNWRFGVGLGAGEFLKSSDSMPLNTGIKKEIYNAFLELKKDLEGTSIDKKENIFASPKVPKWFFIAIANHSWVTAAKKNGLKKSDIYKQLCI